MLPWLRSVLRLPSRFLRSRAELQRSGNARHCFPLVHLSYVVSNASTSQHGLCRSMILDIARLLLFPALMAFAAASDLLTMTISNRVSLALVAGFLALALLSGLGLYDILSPIGAGAAVLAVAFACFAMGWIGGGDAQVAAGGAPRVGRRAPLHVCARS